MRCTNVYVVSTDIQRFFYILGIAYHHVPVYGIAAGYVAQDAFQYLAGAIGVIRKKSLKEGIHGIAVDVLP